MKRIHLFTFGTFLGLFASCGSSEHFMRDDVYATRTPMVPIGTDLRDETDYAAYAYKRDRVEEKIEYQTNQNNWNNFRNSTVIFNNGFIYNRNDFGYLGSPTFAILNRHVYMGLGYWSGPRYYYGVCNVFGYSSVGYYGYTAGYMNPWYYNSNYYSNNNYWNQNYGYSYYNQYSKPQATGSSSSSGSISRGLTNKPTVSYGNSPRMIRTSTTQASNTTAIRSTATGTISSGNSTSRSASINNNTAVRVSNRGNGTVNASSPSAGTTPGRTSGSSVDHRPIQNNPGRNTGINNSSPSRGTSTPRTSSPSGGGGSRPTGGSTGPVGGSRGTGRR